MAEQKAKTTIATPIFMVSYPALDAPRTSTKFPKAPPKYSIEMIFNKETEELDKKYSSKTSLQGLKDAINSITKQVHGDNAIPATWRVPLKPGSAKAGKKGEELYKDAFFMVGTNQDPVPLKDQFKQDMDPTVKKNCYFGMFARAVITLCEYPDGVSCFLEGVQKIQDGTPIGGKGVSVDAYIDEVPVDSMAPTDVAAPTQTQAVSSQDIQGLL